MNDDDSEAASRAEDGFNEPNHGRELTRSVTATQSYDSFLFTENHEPVQLSSQSVKTDGNERGEDGVRKASQHRVTTARRINSQAQISLYGSDALCHIASFQSEPTRCIRE